MSKQINGDEDIYFSVYAHYVNVGERMGKNSAQSRVVYSEKSFPSISPSHLVDNASHDYDYYDHDSIVKYEIYVMCLCIKI